jgi:hypothetical protein
VAARTGFGFGMRTAFAFCVAAGVTFGFAEGLAWDAWTGFAFAFGSDPSATFGFGPDALPVTGVALVVVFVWPGAAALRPRSVFAGFSDFARSGLFATTGVAFAALGVAGVVAAGFFVCGTDAAMTFAGGRADTAGSCTTLAPSYPAPPATATAASPTAIFVVIPAAPTPAAVPAAVPAPIVGQAGRGGSARRAFEEGQRERERQYGERLERAPVFQAPRGHPGAAGALVDVCDEAATLLPAEAPVRFA